MSPTTTPALTASPVQVPLPRSNSTAASGFDDDNMWTNQPSSATPPIPEHAPPVRHEGLHATDSRHNSDPCRTRRALHMGSIHRKHPSPGCAYVRATWGRWVCVMHVVCVKHRASNLDRKGSKETNLSQSFASCEASASLSKNSSSYSAGSSSWTFLASLPRSFASSATKMYLLRAGT